MTLTTQVQDAALQIVAEWLGRQGLGEPTCPDGRDLTPDVNHADDGTECERVQFGPAPTGRDAARQARGPMLSPEWGWPSSGPTPTILLEGGPDGWAYNAAADDGVRAKFARLDIWAEPYASYALCLYPADGIYPATSSTDA